MKSDRGRGYFRKLGKPAGGLVRQRGIAIVNLTEIGAECCYKFPMFLNKTHARRRGRRQRFQMEQSVARNGG